MNNSKQVRDKSPLNFDEWMRLAKNDPDEFEEKRLRHIELFFDNIPAEKLHRLKGLQWQIDQARKLSNSPMASCIAISSMMWDSVDRLKEHQYELVSITRGYGSRVKKEPISATILPMDSRTH